MIARITSGGTLTESPIGLPFVFTSVPALVSYDGGAGNTAMTYPASSPGAPGTQGSPIAVAKNGAGGYVLAGTFWRPQRQGVAGAGEAATMDIGGLAYSITVQPPRGSSFTAGSATQCSAASLSTTDASLTVQSEGGSIGDLVDGRADAASDPANTFAASVNLSACMSAKGVTLKPGDTFNAGIEARSGGIGSLSGFAGQSFTVRAV